MNSGRGALELSLVPAHLLTRQAERGRDLSLGNILVAGVTDGLTQRQACFPDMLAGLQVSVPGSDYIAHRVGHLPIVTRVWPMSSMRHK